MKRRRDFPALRTRSVRPGHQDRHGGRRRRLQFERLEPRQLLTAQFLITEFMASNVETILDEDGESSDWIEVYNGGDQSGSLLGYHLTDDPAALDKWAFPDVELAPRQYLLVWASNKDRQDPLAPLHTNFKLAAGGGYLALVEPDGQTIVTSFDPQYPPQIPDVSYGADVLTNDTVLVGPATQSQVLVPTDGSLGGSWRSPQFTAGAEWTQTTGNGSGFDLDDEYDSWIQTDLQSEMYDLNATVYTRHPFVLGDPYFDSLQLNVKYDDGMVVYVNGDQVVQRNAPSVPSWNSTATQSRADSAANVDEKIDLTAAAGLLSSGDNLLAIQGLNVSAGDSDFLIAPELIGTRVIYGASRFFALSSPGRSNHLGTGTPTLLIADLTASNMQPADNENVAVTARVLEERSTVTAVKLHYRVMYGSETTVSMFDDGMHGDGTAGDGLYGASIPHTISDPGEMVRYYVTATDAIGLDARYPEFLDPQNSPEYEGVVVADGVQSDLPIYHWFTPNPNWFRNSNGTNNSSYTSASLFFDGMFYDNIHIRTRGDTSANFLAPKFKFRFNDDHEFRYDPDLDTVQTFNLEPTWADPSNLRLTLGFEIFREAGSYASLAFPVHTRMNGEFYRLSVFVERINKPFLRRNDLDDQGAVYKAVGVRDSTGKLYPAANLGTTAGMEKVNREEIDPSVADLNQLIAGLGTGNPNRGEFLFDNVNVPEVLNTMSVYALLKHYDRNTHNYFVYRDTLGTGLWSLIAWDLDSIWDRLTEPLWGRYFTGSPYEGSSDYPSWSTDYWNYLYDAIIDNPVTREMYMRRLRTLMDQILQPPSTPVSQRKLEAKIDQYAAMIDWEAKADYDIWGEINEGAWGTQGRFPAGLSQLKSSIQNRRLYLYNSGFTTPQPTNPNIRFGEADIEPASGNQDQEYLQLVNDNNFGVDISGWRLQGGIRHVFAPGTVIPSHGVLYVTPDEAAFRARSVGPTGGQGLFVQGGYQGQLSRFGETVELLDGNDRLVNSFSYDLIVHPLVVTEINYHPYPPSSEELQENVDFTASDFEFLEITNSGTQSIDVTGMVVSDGVAATLAGALAAGQRGVVVHNLAAFTARYGSGVQILGQFSEGSLNDDGERIELEDGAGNPLLRLTYDDNTPWPDWADGRGSTLELVSNAIDYGDPLSWRRSANVGGSPGQGGSAPEIDIVINEVLTHTDLPQLDAIELLNTSNVPVDISGWYLSDSANDYRKFRIPDGSVLAPGQYLVCDEDDFNASGGASTDDFALDSAHGDNLWLVATNFGGQLTRLVDYVAFGAAANGVSLGRWPNGTGALYPMVTVTLSDANSGPRSGQVVISEVMYHPPVDPNEILEFVEIFNTSDETIDLTGWTLDGAVDFAFPPATMLGPYEVLTIVSFDPRDPLQAANLAAFRSAYYISDEVSLVGGFAGKLDNTGEQLRLNRPDEPPADDPQFVPALLEDEVTYDDQLPWPLEADGTGLSLTRVGLRLWGNDPNSWSAESSSPGFANHAPIALDDRYLIQCNSVGNALRVLKNDSSGLDTGESLQLLDVGVPDQGGVVAISAGGTQLVYDPPADFLGTETWTYQIHDGLGGVTLATVIITVAESASWHHAAMPHDVSGDLQISPIDVLFVISNLNTMGARLLPIPPEPPDAPAPYLDVDNNGWTSPLDVLLIIDFLNRVAEGESGDSVLAEGEFSGVGALAPWPGDEAPEEAASAVKPFRCGPKVLEATQQLPPVGTPKTRTIVFDERRATWRADLEEIADDLLAAVLANDDILRDD